MGMDHGTCLRVHPHDLRMDTPFAGGNFASQMLAFKGDKAHFLRVHFRGRTRWGHPDMLALAYTYVAAAAMIESLLLKRPHRVDDGLLATRSGSQLGCILDTPFAFRIIPRKTAGTVVRNVLVPGWT